MAIGPYEIVARIGEGGMGVVFRGRAPDRGDVAIKVLRLSGPDVVPRFFRELRLIASLSRAKGFIPLVDAGQTQEGPYLVMPFMAGGTLRKKLDAGPLPIDATVALGRALARALARIMHEYASTDVSRTSWK